MSNIYKGIHWMDDDCHMMCRIDNIFDPDGDDIEREYSYLLRICVRGYTRAMYFHELTEAEQKASELLPYMILKWGGAKADTEDQP